jgi:predicted nuclease of predicted toxin-antitoxin system
MAGADDSMVRKVAIKTGRILVTLDGDFANIIRYPAWLRPGVIRFRVHPATEEAIRAALAWAIPRLAGISVEGKLIVIDGKKMRMRS